MSTGRGAAVEIPASTKKVVQQLKEVVGNKADEEIYAMLKECNMDLNETAQRLLNQGDPFHEVKRKRDKKKEGGGVKETVDVRGRLGSGGNYGRGGGRGGGAGRGNSLPRHNSVDYSGGRGRPFVRENGIHPSLRSSSAIPNSSSGSQGLSKASVSPPVSVAAPVASQPATSQAQGPSTTGGISSGLANGSSNYVRPAPVPQGAWSAGHATMADILKARAGPPPVLQTPSASPSVAAVPAPPSTYYATAGPSVLDSEASEFYSSATDPVLHSLDSHAVGAQRPIGDRPTNSSSGEMGLALSSQSQQSLPMQSIPMPTATETGSVETEVEDASIRPSSPLSISPPSITDAALDEAVVNMEAGTSPGPQLLQAGGRTVLGGSQFNGGPMYVSQQQPVGTQKAGVGIEWKPKVSMESTVGGSTESSSQGRSTRDAAMLEQAMHTLNMQDNEPVIIPNHLRVPEADRTQLSFGSFGADFRTSFGTSFGMEDVEKSSVSHVESVPGEEIPVEQLTPSSVEAPVALAEAYGHQQAATPEESLNSSMEAPSLGHTTTVAPPLEQLAKPEPVVQQSAHYPFLGVSNYPGFGLMPQIPGAQYSYEQVEPHQQDVSRIPSLMLPYSDPTTSYYTSAFRPGTDGESRYFPHPSSNTSNKYNTNMGLMANPSLPSSQEGVNPMLTASTPSGAQTSQPGSNVQQAAQAVPQQQAVPMHYPTQPPLGHFGNFLGYQYVPPTYPYLQPPYHHSYNPNSSGYGQPPTGSSYTPAAASSYPTGGGTAVKYPLPQYKPGSGGGNVAHSAGGVGYGAYTPAASGYVTNPAATVGNSAGYEDVNTTHYKDNTLYIPGQQQGEGSTVWIQQALPRDMVPSGGMQTNSYYNLGGQGQHSGYTHAQQPTHGHAHPSAGYGNLYHPSQQSGPAPSHQMLQQPQGMGGGAGNAQGGGYQQQPQRTQQTWNPNY